jgi:hypothetical protein
MSDQSVFLYLGPEHGDKQCGSCMMWVRSDRCTIHGKVRVTASMSCGYYLNGAPSAKAVNEAVVTPDESGLVDREVRCENCRWGGPKVYECGLFELLNSRLGSTFKIDTKIDPKGCCNAQEPRAESKKREERLSKSEL